MANHRGRTVLTSRVLPRSRARAPPSVNLDDWQMRLVCELAHDELEPGADASLHRRVGRRTARSLGPALPRLVPRARVGGWSARIDLERRAPAEGLVRAVLVVPDRVAAE